MPAQAGIQGKRPTCSPGFPLSRRAVRGKSSIGEIELVWGIASWLRGWCRLVDAGQGSTLEPTSSHQIGEAQGRQARPAGASGDAQQPGGGQGSEDLDAGSVFGAGEGGAGCAMLLD